MRRYQATVQGTDNWLYTSEAQALNEWVYSLLIGKYIAERAPTLFVKYENIIANQRKEAERISTFLGIKPFNFDVNISTHDNKPIERRSRLIPASC
jgi:hypothetical protein